MGCGWLIVLTAWSGNRDYAVYKPSLDPSPNGREIENKRFYDLVTKSFSAAAKNSYNPFSRSLFTDIKPVDYTLTKNSFTPYATKGNRADSWLIDDLYPLNLPFENDEKSPSQQSTRLCSQPIRMKITTNFDFTQV
jgi:hypothetical protein